MSEYASHPTMRLLNARTFEIDEFLNDLTRPQYAILSHTWHEGEVTYQDMLSLDTVKGKPGFTKIQYTCEQALKDELTHVWIDTCCIDKTSSAELSEAINSMFRWYKESQICYAYLTDVEDEPLTRSSQHEVSNSGIPKPYNPTNATKAEDRFVNSRWFKRGWTLQELLAPTKLHFYGPEWSYLGALEDIVYMVTYASKVPTVILTKHRDLFQVSAAKRMSWAASRETTKIEDEAYSLLGMFNVSMPLLYGEGRKAFRRLQEHIISATNDHSLLAWRRTGKTPVALTFDQPIFAPRASDFADCGFITRLPPVQGDNFCSVTSNGLQLRARSLAITHGNYLVILDCFDDRAEEHCIGLSGVRPLFSRIPNSTPDIWPERRVLVERKTYLHALHQTLILQDVGSESNCEGRVYLRFSEKPRWPDQLFSLRVCENYPPDAWELATDSWCTNSESKIACMIELDRRITNRRTNTHRHEQYRFRIVFTHAEPRALPLSDVDWSRRDLCVAWVALDDGRSLADLCNMTYDLHFLDQSAIRLADDLGVEVEFLHGPGP